jgi:hypothetical protein
MSDLGNVTSVLGRLLCRLCEVENFVHKNVIGHRVLTAEHKVLQYSEMRIFMWLVRYCFVLLVPVASRAILRVKTNVLHAFRTTKRYWTLLNPRYAFYTNKAWHLCGCYVLSWLIVLLCSVGFNTGLTTMDTEYIMRLLLYVNASHIHINSYTNTKTSPNYKHHSQNLRNI